MVLAQYFHYRWGSDREPAGFSFHFVRQSIVPRVAGTNFVKAR